MPASRSAFSMAMRRSDCTPRGVGDIGQRDAQAEHQRAVAEFFEDCRRRRVAQHLGMIVGALLQDGDHLLGIGTVADADLDVDGAERVAMRPVEHAAGDQLGVGDDQAGAVEGLDLGGPHADAAHVALLIADDDAVADLDRPLDQQDQPGDEVVDDRLQAEADADRQGAGDDGEVGDVEAGIGYGQQRGQRDADVAHHRVDRIDDAGVHARLLQRLLPQPALEQPGGEQAAR